MTDPLPEEVVAQHRATLEGFVVRARRIEGHSLLGDKEQFSKWALGTVNVRVRQIVDDDGRPTLVGDTITWDLPPEEAFESLAARVRPLTLQDERVHYGKVFGALRSFVRDDSERRHEVDTLRDAWRTVHKPDQPILMGLAPTLDRPEKAASYVDVADAWMYGDLVHADPRGWERVGRLPLSQRYIAAVLVYGQTARRAVGTLNLIRRYQDEGVLGLDYAVLADAVAVTMPMTLPLSKVAITPVDAQNTE